MFLGNTKDLKKGEALRTQGRKATTGQARSSGSRAGEGAPKATAAVREDSVDLVGAAAKAREERARKKELNLYAFKIQALARGFIARSTYVKSLRQGFDSKMTDLVKLSALLGSRGVTFAPPPNVVLDLLSALFLFGLNVDASKERKGGHIIKLEDDIHRVILFCQHVLNPSLTQLEAKKNCIHSLVPEITLGVNVKLVKLVRGVLGCLSPVSAKRAGLSERDINAVLLTSIKTLFGPGPTEELQQPFRCLHATLLERTATTCQSSLFAMARQCISLYTAPFLRTLDESEDEVGRLVSLRHKHAERVASCLFGVCCELVSEVGSSTQATRLEAFYLELMTCPMLTLLLSAEIKSAFSNSIEFFTLLGGLVTQPLPSRGELAGVTGADAFEKGHWLQGNLFHLGPSIRVMSSISSAGTDKVDEVADEALISYLNACLHLTGAYHLPYIFHGKATVLWTKHGKSNLVAIGMPVGLHEQLQGLVHKDFMRALYRRVLLPVREDACTYAGEGPKAVKRLGEQIAEVRESLQKDGKAIASASLIQEQEEATWFTGKWASKVLKKFNRALGISPGSGDKAGIGEEEQASIAAAAAAAEAASPVAREKEAGADGLYAGLPETTYRECPPLIRALVSLWAVVLPQCSQPAASRAGQSNRGSLGWRSLSALVFSTHLTDRLWVVAVKYGGAKEGIVGAADSFGVMLSSEVSIEEGGSASAIFSPSHHFCASLVCFTAAMRMTLGALDDEEVYVFGRPLPLSQLLGAIKAIKATLYSALVHNPSVLSDPSGSVATPPSAEKDGRSAPLSLAAQAYTDSINRHLRQFQYFAARGMSAVMADLHSMWARKAFSASSLWTVEEACDSRDVRAALVEEFWVKNTLANSLLYHVPGAISFHERMKLFRKVVDRERLEIQGDPNPNSGARRPSIVFQVRRNMLLEDGMKAMEKITGANIKMRIQIQYINEYGEAEAGIDIGGLFKDFVTDLSDRIFDPNYGLFCMTAQNYLYPNPAASQLYDEHELVNLFSFLGRVLGKALYENITLQPQFAHFFLAFMHGRYNFQHMLSDLVTLDPELHKNLLFLKSYDGDVQDLCLTFSVSDTSLGGAAEVPLFPGGEHVEVTASNRHQYINAVAKHYLHDRLKVQAGAFFHGLYQALDRDLLGIFAPPELQVLISGASTGINLNDLRSNCRYNGYTGLDRTILNFWAVLEAMSERDRALLVKFVTSCERPPSLGFSSLDPPFSIQRGPNDDTRLPTASTCFNVLKLPAYSSKAKLEEKLLAAIRSGAGFELS